MSLAIISPKWLDALSMGLCVCVCVRERERKRERERERVYYIILQSVQDGHWQAIIGCVLLTTPVYRYTHTIILYYIAAYNLKGETPLNTLTQRGV